MAKQTVVSVTCDYCGADIADGGAEDVVYGVQDSAWAADLCGEHLDELVQTLLSWGESGRRLSGERVGEPRKTKRRPPTKARARKSAKKSPATSASAIRSWAREQGIEVPDRGRIPASVRQSYEDAH